MSNDGAAVRLFGDGVAELAGGPPDDVVERLAELVVARLVELEAGGGIGSRADVAAAKLMTVGQVAELLGVPRDYVYRHKEALGVIRLPSEGRRGALRFDRQGLRERLRQRAAASNSLASGSGRRGTPARQLVAGGDLLPVRPRQAA